MDIVLFPFLFNNRSSQYIFFNLLGFYMSQLSVGAVADYIKCELIGGGPP